QIERAALRPVANEPPARCEPPQILLKRWSCAHSIDARARKIVPLDRCHIAGSEHVGVRYGLQGRRNADETFCVERKTGFPKPTRWLRLGGPKHLVDGNSSVALDLHGAGLDCDHTAICHDHDATLREDCEKPFPRRRREIRQDRKSTRLNSSHVKISYAV